jgi:hypothetical protein
MKVRYSINDDGELVSRDGHVLGRVTSLTIEAPTIADDDPANSGDERGTIGGVVVVVKEEQEQQKINPTCPRDRVWAHYVNLFGTHYKLNDMRKRMIDNALKVRSEERCIQAVSGLRLSPFHNGENDQRKKYLDIRYALKGNSARGESNDERIDKMAALADDADAAVNSSSPSLRVPALVDRNGMLYHSLRGKLNMIEVHDRDGNEEAKLAVMAELPSGFQAIKGVNDVWRIVEGAQ